MLNSVEVKKLAEKEFQKKFHRTHEVFLQGPSAGDKYYAALDLRDAYCIAYLQGYNAGYRNG